MQGPASETHEATGASPPNEGGAGGLPQFDLATWPGQAAWFLIFFVIVLVLMARVFVPRIGGTIAEREGKIEGDVAEARRLKDEADSQAAAAQAEMAQARDSAMAGVSTIASDAAKAIVEKLTGKAATAAELGSVGRA